ncbi:MAG: OmpA family protein [Acidiferrobacterales bacterium]|nr:OmpA family protein [Acidiferrobacterales bacterium]
MYEKQNTIRFRIKRKTPSFRENFFPWGLLGILLILLPLLFALLWFAKNSIQESVQTYVKNELVSKNLDWVNVAVDGQAVTLSGSGTKLEGDRAIALAKQVKDDAWFGRFGVPSRVQGNFAELAPEVVAPVAQEIVEEPVVAAQPVWGNIAGDLESGVLTLSGTVASDQEKQTLLSMANDAISAPRLRSVVDQLQISEEQLLPASANLASRVVETLSLCNSGRANSSAGIYSIECQVTREQAADIQALASTPVDGASLGNIFLSSSDECNASFVQILEGKAIGFASGSAELVASSTLILDEVAELAKSCPGNIRVEGHTDVSGQLETNMVLSEARAKSVVEALVERGVERERLFPEGFGPTQPRAEGNTREAYALNRRIEFHVSD